MIIENKKKNRATKNLNSLAPKIFSKALYKTNFSSKKGSQFILGIDILKNDIKNELLLLTILRIEEVTTRLLTNKEYYKSFQRNSRIVFFDCLKKVCEDFLTMKYGYKGDINISSLKLSFYTQYLLQDTEILFKTPLVSLIDLNVRDFRSFYYPIYGSASESFLEALIDNLVLELSNCVVYYSLTKFSSIYAFRQLLYKSKFLSLRNLERFKNNLNWQLSIRNYVQRPLNLYNNRQEIYILKTTGIYCKVIYANRSKEVNTLKNLSLLTISIIDITDFIKSRFDETLFIGSKSLRFTLTNFLGQSIGLIWRGIIEGLKK